jgi:hypothetical protein
VVISDNFDHEKNIGTPFLIEDEQIIISPSIIDTAYTSKPAGMETAQEQRQFPINSKQTA